MKFPALLKCLIPTPWDPPPHRGGVGQHFLLLIFWTVHDISRTCDFVPLKTPLELPWGGVGQFCLGESQSHIIPHLRTKFGCGPTVVSKKRGGTHTYTHTHARTHARTHGRTHARTNTPFFHPHLHTYKMAVSIVLQLDVRTFSVVIIRTQKHTDRQTVENTV